MARRKARRSFIFLLAALLPAAFSSCDRDRGPVGMDKLTEACSQWCSSSYKSNGSRHICAETCRIFGERFQACLDRESSCRKARKCVAEAMKKECSSRDGDREICTLGTEYAYSISMDYCIDRAERL